MAKFVDLSFSAAELHAWTSFCPSHAAPEGAGTQQRRVCSRPTIVPPAQSRVPDQFLIPLKSRHLLLEVRGVACRERHGHAAFALVSESVLLQRMHVVGGARSWGTVCQPANGRAATSALSTWNPEVQFCETMLLAVFGAACLPFHMKPNRAAPPRARRHYRLGVNHDPPHAADMRPAWMVKSGPRCDLPGYHCNSFEHLWTRCISLVPAEFGGPQGEQQLDSPCRGLLPAPQSSPLFSSRGDTTGLERICFTCEAAMWAFLMPSHVLLAWLGKACNTSALREEAAASPRSGAREKHKVNGTEFVFHVQGRAGCLAHQHHTRTSLFGGSLQAGGRRKLRPSSSSTEPSPQSASCGIPSRSKV